MLADFQICISVRLSGNSSATVAAADELFVFGHNGLRHERVNGLRILWRLLTILKTSKKVYEVMFFDM